MESIKRYCLPFGLLIVLIFVVLGPAVFMPGYIFSPDFIITPTFHQPEQLSSSMLFYFVLYFINFVIPADVLQKILLVTSLVVIGCGAAYFIKKHIISKANHYGRWPMYLAAVLYIFNPYVYSHFLMGQYSVLLGYALIPFFTASLLSFLKQPSWRRALMLSLVLVMVSIVSIHTLGILIIISLPLLSLFAYRQIRDLQWFKNVLSFGVLAAAIFLILSSYWIIPIIQGKGRVVEALNNFRDTDFAAFATNDQGLGVLGNILTMQGFWADGANLYLTAQDKYEWWWIPVAMLIGLVGIGVYKGWLISRGLTLAFMGMLVSAVVLASGTSGTVFAFFNSWLIDHIPFFAGYREPQKFVAIVVFVYTIFASIGLMQIIEWIRKARLKEGYNRAIILLVFLIPIGCAPLMLGGFGGQVRASDYPADWYEMNTFFKQANLEEEKIIALPWHMYMRFNFSGRVIANPMDAFFDPVLIISGNPEFKGSNSYKETSDQQIIETALGQGVKGTDMIKILKSIDVQYVLLAKEFDYKKYSFLDMHDDFEIVKDSTTLRLYKVKDETGIINR